MLLSEMCCTVALLYDVSLSLDFSTGAKPLFLREAAAPTPVPAPLLDGERVGAEAESAPGDAVQIVHCMKLLGVGRMDRQGGVNPNVP